MTEIYSCSYLIPLPIIFTLFLNTSMCSKPFMNKESIQDLGTWANFHSTGFICTCGCQTATPVFLQKNS